MTRGSRAEPHPDHSPTRTSEASERAAFERVPSETVLPLRARACAKCMTALFGLVQVSDREKRAREGGLPMI